MVERCDRDEYDTNEKCRYTGDGRGNGYGDGNGNGSETTGSGGAQEEDMVPTSPGHDYAHNLGGDLSAGAATGRDYKNCVAAMSMVVAAIAAVGLVA